MPNPRGINGYGTKDSEFILRSLRRIILGLLLLSEPADDVLKASLIKYRDERQTQNQKLQSLAKDHGYVIGYALMIEVLLSIVMYLVLPRTTKLNQEENRLGISSKRRFKPSAEQVRQAVSDEVEKDLARGNGPDFIQDQLKHNYNLHVGR